MLKLMLVDDEPITRKGIRTSIDWKKYDVEIICEASNGKDALEKALELRPHVVLTDIRMPVMDGLTLSACLREQLPDTKVIILSGHEDFSYAKKALSLGVTEYLLKPVDANSLISVISQLYTDIVAEQNQKERKQSANLVFNENFPQIKSKFINRILKEDYGSTQEIMETAEALRLELSGPDYLVFVVDIDDFFILTEDLSAKDKDLIKFSVVNISEELLNQTFSGCLCYSEFEHIIAVVSSRNITYNAIEKLSRDIQYYVGKHLKFTVSIGVGKIYSNILELGRSYSEALTALKQKIYSGKSSIIQFISLDNMTAPDTVIYPISQEKEIVGFLKTLNLAAINTILDSIFTKFIENNASPENIKNICSRLIIISIGCVEEMGINISGSLGANFSPYNEIAKYDTLIDLKEWMTAFFSNIINMIQQNKNLKFKGIIKNALQYIEDNYNKELTLSDIANVVFVTPNYLSRIFKEEMQVNFIDWLNKYRIEKAKDMLLEPGAKTYEVAEKVGYGDYKYFSQIFKKYTGITPKDFKDRNNK